MAFALERHLDFLHFFQNRIQILFSPYIRGNSTWSFLIVAFNWNLPLALWKANWTSYLWFVLHVMMPLGKSGAVSLLRANVFLTQVTDLALIECDRWGYTSWLHTIRPLLFRFSNTTYLLAVGLNKVHGCCQCFFRWMAEITDMLHSCCRLCSLSCSRQIRTSGFW